MAFGVWYKDLEIELNLTEPDLGHPEYPGLWDHLYTNRPKKWESGHLQCLQCREERPECPEWMYLQVRPGGRRVAVHHNGNIADHPFPESDEHKALKERIASAAVAGGFSADIEDRAADGRRRTDVLVHGRDGFLLGAEAQLSYITAQAVRKRSRIAVGHGITPLWATTSRTAAVIDRAPWARIDPTPWHDIANGTELPVRGGIRMLDFQRCVDRQAPCPDRPGRGRCDKWHATWVPAGMRFDDLIVRAAGEEWVPLGYRTSAKREAWFWVKSEDRSIYEEHSGAVAEQVAWNDGDEETGDAADLGAEPLSKLCLYPLNRRVRSKHVKRRTSDVRDDDGGSMPLVAFTVDRWPPTGSVSPPATKPERWVAAPAPRPWAPQLRPVVSPAIPSPRWTYPQRSTVGSVPQQVPPRPQRVHECSAGGPTCPQPVRLYPGGYRCARHAPGTASRPE